MSICWLVFSADACSDIGEKQSAYLENVSDSSIYVLYYTDLNKTPSLAKAFENKASARIIPPKCNAYILFLKAEDVNGNLPGDNKFYRLFFHAYAIEMRKFQDFDEATIIKEDLYDSVYTFSFADSKSSVYLKYSNANK